MRVAKFMHVPSILLSLAGEPRIWFHMIFLQLHKINVTSSFSLLSYRNLISEGFLVISLLPSINLKYVPSFEM